MQPQSLWELTVPVRPIAEEATVALIERLCGQAPSVLVDERTARRRVIAYFSDRVRAENCRRQMVAEIQRWKDPELSPRQPASVRKLKAQDWAESWKNHFRDLKVGKALLVKPSWSKLRPDPGQAVVTLDPGLAFGTGLHPTTHFCLRQVVQHRPRTERRSCLDLGTGSGILAIAAAKLGYDPVDAIDNDAVSIRVARANAIRNGVSIKIVRRDLLAMPLTSTHSTRSRNGQSSGSYDVVCANLLYDVLLSARKQIVQSVRPGGVLVLAGILTHQFADVAATYCAMGLTVLRQRTEKEWSSCALRK